MKPSITLSSIALLLSACATTQEKTTGGIEREVIDQRIQQERPNLHNCYSHENKKTPGKITVDFVINAEGKVEKIDAESTLKNKKVETCVTNIIKNIQFPKPAGGGTVEIKYPFAFTPKK